MTLKALIFDFDGLILDIETPDFIVLSEQYRRYGVDLRPERWMHGLGTTGRYDPYAELESLTGVILDHEALRREHRERYVALCAQHSLQPGVHELIVAARERGICLAVASSASREWVEGWLAHHGIRDHFHCVRIRSDGLPVKPAPDLFLSAAVCLDAAPEHCAGGLAQRYACCRSGRYALFRSSGRAARLAPVAAQYPVPAFTGRSAADTIARSAGA